MQTPYWVKKKKSLFEVKVYCHIHTGYKGVYATTATATAKRMAKKQ